MGKTNDFSGASKYYDVILGKEKFEKNARFVSQLLKKHNANSVLELGCGSGLYLFPLKKAGFDVEGLDISKKMLEQAKKRGRIKLYQKDMSAFSLRKKYDAILCLNSSLVLLSNFKLIEKTLRNCKRHLKENGLLLLDLPNHKKEIKENNFSQEHHKYKLGKEEIHVIFREYKKKNRWVSSWDGFVKKGKQYSEFKEHYEELIYFPKKLENTLKKLKFETVSLYGTRNGGAFNERKSYRRFYVCRLK